MLELVVAEDVGVDGWSIPRFGRSEADLKDNDCVVRTSPSVKLHGVVGDVGGPCAMRD